MPSNRVQLLRSIIDETRRLFHRLANVADGAHADLGLTASQRAVLEALSREGPQTVPHIARAKGVSRQHIQAIANVLVEQKRIETRDNPAHQRSALIALTPEGERCFQEIQERERIILEDLAQRFRLAELETTVRTLKRASELFGQVTIDPQEDE